MNVIAHKSRQLSEKIPAYLGVMLEEFYAVDSHSECANDNTPAFKIISDYLLVDVEKKDTVKLVTRKEICCPASTFNGA